MWMLLNHLTQSKHHPNEAFRVFGWGFSTSNFLGVLRLAQFKCLDVTGKIDQRFDEPKECLTCN
jgi:hypothetical protein